MLVPWITSAILKSILTVQNNNIQQATGSGRVDWILCGSNAFEVFSRCRSFQNEIVAFVPPNIERHYHCRMGTLWNGTVQVIRSPSLNPNEYVFGYKGHLIGDSAVILGEYHPLHLQRGSENLRLTSIYDLFVNNPEYCCKGKLLNFHLPQRATNP